MGWENGMLTIVICVVIAFVISLVLIGLSNVVSPSVKDFENVSAFECGFASFNSTSEIVQIRFFLVGLLFVIFDLEISLIVPLNLIIQSSEMIAYWVGFFFIVILTVGLVYEWNKGALNWE